MTVIALILVYAVIALMQIPGLVRGKKWRELAAFSCFLVFALVFSLLLGMGVKIPSPLLMIQFGIQDRFHLHY